MGARGGMDPAPGAPTAVAHRLGRTAVEGARALDALLLVPFFALVFSITLLIAAPHYGPLFAPISPAHASTHLPAPGFVSPGLLGPLWCLWDGLQQCLHEKVSAPDQIGQGAQGLWIAVDQHRRGP